MFKDKRLGALFGTSGQGPEAWIDGDALVIECGGCAYRPVPGSDECIGCMVSCMAETGSVSRIILRTGKDIEVSGRAGEAIREVSSLKVWSLPSKPSRGRCSKCAESRENVLAAAWAGFPNNGFSSAASLLDGAETDSEECAGCMERTRRVLEKTKGKLDDLIDRMAVR